MEAQSANINTVCNCCDGWIVRQIENQERFHYFNIITNETSLNVPACLKALEPSTTCYASSEETSLNSPACLKTTKSVTDTTKKIRPVIKEEVQWQLKVFPSSLSSCNGFSKKILSYYTQNLGMVFDFSLQPAPPRDNENLIENMSNKRHAECEGAPYPSHKRIRRSLSSSSANDTNERDTDIKLLSEGNKEIFRTIETPEKGLSIPSQSFSKNDRKLLNYSVKSHSYRNEAIKPRSSSQHQSEKTSTPAPESAVSNANSSWRIGQSDGSATSTTVSSNPRSPSASETYNLVSPKTWSTAVKVNRAELRLQRLQEKLKQDHMSPLHRPSSSSSQSNEASANVQLAHGKLEIHSTKSPGENIQALRPEQPLRRHSNDNLLRKLPEKVVIKIPLNVAHLPQSQEHSSKNRPSSTSKSNPAADRLEKLRLKLQKKNAEPSAPEGSALPNSSIQTALSKSSIVESKEKTCNIPSSIGRGAVAACISHDKTVDDSFEEQMDWEPTDHQLSEMIMEIQEVRTKIRGRDLIPTQFSPSEMIRASNVKTNYHIVLDSNILMGHLKLVEALRDRQFPVLEPLVLILPWVVIQELDRLKDWKPNRRNDGHSSMAGALARTAVKWINLQLQSKHPRVKGQTSFNRTGPMMVCSVADDSILVCCKEMEPFASNVLLLTEDVNLRNKALMLDIQTLSQSQLKSQINQVVPQTLASSSQSKPNTASNQKVPEPQKPLNVLTETVVSSEESEMSDVILCDVKIRVRNYLDEVAKLELEAAYGNMWISILKVPLPWNGLNEVVQVVIDFWRAVFGYVCRDRKKLLQFEQLRAFLRDKKAYNHSLKEIQQFIDLCIDVVGALPHKSDSAKQVGCINSLKQLKDQSANRKSTPPLAHVDVQAIKLLIEKPMEKAWNELWGFCYVSCKFLRIEHDIEVPPGMTNQMPEINLEMIRHHLVNIQQLFEGLISSLERMLQTPAGQMTSSNSFLQGLHQILVRLTLDSEQYPSIENLAAYFANENCRENIRASIERYWYFDFYIDQIRAFQN